jgi:hypothetical protein
MVRPVGATANRQAVGAVVKITTGGKTMVRPVLAGQGYQSSYCGPLHFGLGSAERVDRIEVRFPGGQSVVLTDVPARQWLTIYQIDPLVKGNS